MSSYEYAVSMPASVLKGKIAVKTSISIIETFTKLKELFAAHRELAA